MTTKKQNIAHSVVQIEWLREVYKMGLQTYWCREKECGKRSEVKEKRKHFLGKRHIQRIRLQQTNDQRIEGKVTG